MNVSSISGSNGNWGNCQMDGVNGGSNNKQTFQDFKALSAALNSGDVSTASQAFATVQQDIQNSQNASGKTPFDPNSQIGKDFQAVGDALKSGDISAAKQAFATLKQDMRSAHHAGHAHRHHHSDNDGDGTSSTASVTGSSSTTTPVITNSLNLTA